MMDQRTWRVIPAVLCLFALCLSRCNGSGGLECNLATAQPGHSGELLSAVIDPQRAEKTQRQHLEDLFNRYGENGTISLVGLKRLLQSVGLDRIRNVMVQHHDQPGEEEADNHSHAHHHHHHRHHHDDNNTRHQKHAQAEPSEPRKFPKTPKAQDASTVKKVENSDAHHNLYNKKTTTAAQELTTTPTYTTHLMAKTDGGRRRRDAQDASPAGLDVTGGGATGLNGPATEAQTQQPAVSQESFQDDHDHYDSDHTDEKIFPNRSRDYLADNVECLNASTILSAHGMSNEMVLTVGDFRYLCPALLNQIDARSCVLHGDHPDHGRQDHNHHKHGHGHHDHGHHDYSDHRNHSSHGGESSKNIAIAWVGGFVSITVISLLSLLGVVLIPLMNRVFFKFLLSFLVALAVGTLSGDAFLHLIPHSQGGHHHHHHDDSGNETAGHDFHSSESSENLDGVWKGLTALSGVYIMFLIEHFLTLGKMYKDKKQKIQKKWDQNDKGDLEKLPALEENDLKSNEDAEPNGAGAFGDLSGGLHGGSVAEEEQVMLAPQVAVVTPQGYARAAASSAAAYTDEDCENKCHSHFHDTVGQADHMHHHHHDYHHILHHHHSQNHHPHSHSHSYSEQHFQEAGVATLAWMVIMGDGLHNFSDGLAIGAAFTDGLSSGLSTSVAVFCHELPHELGDFAVLLKAGMTVRQAILYNVLSAMMAYLGMITGIVIGHYADNISMWIFALTAGLFMYVALVDMVPEMLHNDAGDHGFSHWGFFLLQNAGILLGFCIMLLIAIFEHNIKLDLGY
ncbi:zinc transporter ZIP6 [Polymixia lowei]